jgi:hypothetical protein
VDRTQPPDRSAIDERRDSQAALAEQLIAKLGYEAALEACRRHCWYGTIREIERRRLQAQD